MSYSSDIAESHRLAGGSIQGTECATDRHNGKEGD
jgi:hypothetical protein